MSASTTSTAVPQQAAAGSSYLRADTSVPLIDQTVGALLAERAAAHPDRLALVGNLHGGAGERRLTYAEVLTEAQHVATALARLAPPGGMVALWAPNVVEWPLIEYGAALSGVVLVALNPVLRKGELAYALEHSGAQVLLHADRHRDYDMAAVVTELREEFPELRTVSLSDRSTWRSDAIDETVVANQPTDPMVPVMLQYTSGTTGNPKGVLLRHHSLVNVARLTMQYLEIAPGAVALGPLPMFHTAGCVISTLGPLWVGGTLVLVEDFSPVAVLDQLRQENASVLFYVPAVLGALLEAQRTSDRPAPVLTTVLGGASTVSATMIEAAETVFGAAVFNLFGQTELSSVLTATRPGDTRADQLNTVGHPLPHVDVKIVDPASGQVVPIGTPGEICARGYQQLIEYLHDPAATTAAVDEEGFLHTGDMGVMDARGYIALVGRLKDIIIRGGENIAPAEVESCLAAHPAVIDATVLGLPDARMGEVVGAVVRLRDGQPAEDVMADLQAHARQHLSPFKVPSRWFTAATLPTTATGKVRKFELVDLLGTPDAPEVRVAR